MNTPFFVSIVFGIRTILVVAHHDDKIRATLMSPNDYAARPSELKVDLNFAVSTPTVSGYLKAMINLRNTSGARARAQRQALVTAPQDVEFTIIDTKITGPDWSWYLG